MHRIPGCIVLCCVQQSRSIISLNRYLFYYDTKCNWLLHFFLEISSFNISQVKLYGLTIYRLFLLFGFSPSSIFPFLLQSRSMESTIAQSLLYSLIVTSQKPFKERSTNVQMYFHNLDNFLLLSFAQEHNVDYYLPIFHNHICYLILNIKLKKCYVKYLFLFVENNRSAIDSKCICMGPSKKTFQICSISFCAQWIQNKFQLQLPSFYVLFGSQNRMGFIRYTTE